MTLLEGNLADTSLHDVLLQLRGSAQTGILTLQSDEDIIAVSVEKGRIVGADALNESLEEGLGVMLVGEGLVTEAQMESATRRVGAREGRLGDLLTEGGLVSRQDFLAVLRRYTLGIVKRVQEWEQGEFKFYVGDEVSYEEGFEPIRMNEVLPARVFVEPSPGTGQGADEPGSSWRDPMAGPAEELPGSAPAEEVESASGGVAAMSGAEDDKELESDEEQSLLSAFKRRAVEWTLDAPDWVAHVVPLVVMLSLAVVVVWRPNSLVYPFFWLEPDRLELEKQRRLSVYSKIDRGAKTFFLLEGRFPDDLHSLVTRGLLAPEDIVGSGGRILSYRPGDRGYIIRPGSDDGTDPGINNSEAIAGNFFLDPEFVIQTPDRGPPPLVLLD